MKSFSDDVLNNYHIITLTILHAEIIFHYGK